MRAVIASCLLAAMAWAGGVEISAPALANHISAHQCGVSSASYARICRPSAYTSCLRASARGVKGYTKTLCAGRQKVCRSCLGHLRQCIVRIGHAKRSEFSCDECSGKFSRCIGRRYPKLKS
ncbi:MAG: hypothetical protein ABL907_02495 [Hyphomicrobium sp.]